ncbi:hypothetical protein TNIN_318251 [Trichonephila inaurata madagascariensis]|uniref:Uncharacterized protein n=1 Tax=Trichonephila inaurata madagascariensis TaxID=2747483 RepID=A0A8X6XFS3_9ARAC|nr:hypothetical protein TNIN_318251 [Trichonephila inaurata madagascariensis]
MQWKHASSPPKSSTVKSAGGFCSRHFLRQGPIAISLEHKKSSGMCCETLQPYAGPSRTKTGAAHGGFFPETGVHTSPESHKWAGSLNGRRWGPTPWARAACDFHVFGPQRNT